MASIPKLKSLLACLAAAAASALLMAFGTGLQPLWWAAWLAFVPVLGVAAREGLVGTAATVLGAWMLGGLNQWSYLTGSLHLPLPLRLAYLAAAALQATLLALAWRRAIRAGSAWRAVWVLPCLGVSLEYLLSLASPHGTFGSLAYTQLGCLPLVQVASVVGWPGVTFAVLLISGALGLLTASVLPLKPRLQVAGTVAALLLAAVLWGWQRSRGEPPGAGYLSIGLAVTSDPARIYPRDGATARRLLEEYAEVSEQLAREGAQVIVLPEKIAWLNEADAAWADGRFSRAANESGAALVLGWGRREGDKVWNEAVLFTPQGAPLRYAKHHLLPVFEDEFTRGTTHVARRQGGITWGLAICKDMDFSDTSRAQDSLGTALLFVPAWDFDVDGWLHSRMAVLRGVEGGFSVARAAKQGRLTVSDSRGRILGEAVAAGPGFSTLVVKAAPVAQPTLAGPWSDRFAWACVALAALLIALTRPSSNLRSRA